MHERARVEGGGGVRKRYLYEIRNSYLSVLRTSNTDGEAFRADISRALKLTEHTIVHNGY